MILLLCALFVLGFVTDDEAKGERLARPVHLLRALL
jgi:hypothetical protein